MTEEGYLDDDDAPLILVGTGIVVTDPVTKNEYRMKDVIGAASSGGATVYRVDESSDHDEPTTAVAVKIFNIKNKKEDSYWDFKYDILNSRSLSHHPNIIEIKASFTINDHNMSCVVIPLFTFGSLQSLISSRFKSCFSEDCIAIILTETLKGVAHIHNNHHTHKYMSAKSIYLCDTTPAIKLAFGASGFDYGPINPDATTAPLSKQFDWPAPEVRRYCTTMSDIWLLGVTALQLAYGLWVTSTRQGMLGMINKYTKEEEESTEKVGLDTTSLDHEERKLSRSFENVVGMCLAR